MEHFHELFSHRFGNYQFGILVENSVNWHSSDLKHQNFFNVPLQSAYLLGQPFSIA